MSSSVNGDNLSDSTNSRSLPNGQTTSWQGNRGGRDFGNQQRPRGRGRGFWRGRRGRGGGRFRGERRRLWDSRGKGQSDRDGENMVAPGADVRASLDLFYETQRTKEFPPLLKTGTEISNEVEEEVRNFLRNQVQQTSHAHHLTRDDFRALNLSESTIGHLNARTTSESPVFDLVTARRLSGSLGLQLSQWERYFCHLTQLHQLDICCTGTVPPSTEADNAIKAIDDMVTDLDEILAISKQIAQGCTTRLADIQVAKGISKSGNGKDQKKPSSKAASFALACSAVGLSLWCMWKVRQH